MTEARSTPHRRAWRTGVALLAAVATLVVVRPAPASAAPASSATARALPATLTITGHGWGHGRGMGQWGAYGYAVNANWTYHQILAHYYGNTSAGQVGNPTVRIRLTELATSAPHLATGTDYPTTTVWLQNGSPSVDTGAGPQALGWHAVKLVWTAGGLREYVANSCAGPWSGGYLRAASTIKVLPANPAADAAGDTLGICEPSGMVRHVQGQVWAVTHGSGAITVNALPVDDYVMAVVPHEMSPSWANGGTNNAGFNALEAQAVAVRSYGLAANAGSYNTCDSTCQTYIGRWLQPSAGAPAVDLTDGRTTLATAATSGDVRLRNGAVIATEYSASTGGWTAGGTFPAVVDAGDAVAGNPNHTWTTTVARSTIEHAEGKGTLTAITVVSRNGHGAFGGRVDTLQLTFTGGTVTLTGTQFQTLVGLKSNWFSFGQACGDPSQPLAPFPSVIAMVDQQYTDLLDRAPDAAGAQSWVDQVVCHQHTGPWVITGMLGARETQKGFVAVVRLYEGVFPRTPDAGGVLYWRHQVTTGLSLSGLAARLTASAEFHNAHAAQTNAAFVAAMYQQMLGRAPDAGGAAYWTAQLDGGQLSRAGFVLVLSGSAEYGQHWATPTAVNEVYIGLLRRTADPGGASYWSQALAGGTSFGTFVSSVYGSAEYTARF